MEQRRNTLARSHWFFFITLLCQLSLYIASSGNYGVLDDATSIEPLFSELSRSGSVPIELAFENRSSPLGRPLAVLSLVEQINMGHDYSGFKIGNILIHTIIVLFAYVVMVRAANVCSETRSIFAIGVILWGLNPFWISTLLYSVQRMAVLAALFSICAYTLSILVTTNLKGFRLYGYSLLIFLILTLGVLSKENAVTTVVAILITKLWLTSNDSFGDMKKIALFSCLVFFPVFFAYVASDFWIVGYDYRDFSLSERLMTQVYLVPYFTTQIIFLQGMPSLMHDDVKVIETLADMRLFLPAIFWILVFFVTIKGALAKRRMWRLASALFMSYFVTLSLESTFLPLELHFDHRYYLPAFFLYSSVALALGLLFGKRFQRVLQLILLCYCTASLAKSIEPAEAWSTAVSQAVWEYELSPESARANSLMAEAFATMQNEDMAYGYSARSYELSSHEKDWDLAFRNIYLACIASGSYQARVHDLKVNSEYLFFDADAIHAFGWALAGGRCGRELIEDWLLANGNLLVNLPQNLVIDSRSERTILLYIEGLKEEYFSLTNVHGEVK